MPRQFGFLPERQLGDAVLLLESAALHAVRRTKDAAMFFVDFRAAFPSIVREWIDLVLRRLGVPTQFVRAFRGLYAGDSAVLRFGSLASRVFRVSAGIRQGCPCSGSIFASAIDPVLRMLLCRIPRPLNTLVACADDIALMLTSFVCFVSCPYSWTSSRLWGARRACSWSRPSRRSSLCGQRMWIVPPPTFIGATLARRALQWCPISGTRVWRSGLLRMHAGGTSP